MPLQTPTTQEDHARSNEQARVLHQLLGEIETVRLKRQEDYREQGHPQLKRFTQQELNDEVCPTYKNWLIGRSHRLPTRSMLMTIADYLEGTLSERNDLLLAAQYLPEETEWEGNTQRHALEQAQQMMETLPYPAIVVTRTFQIHAANEFFLRLLELPPLHAIPPHQRSAIHFLFHPDFGIRTRSTMNAEARSTWQKNVLYGIQHFKQTNVLHQYDAWYQQFVEQCCGIADFREHWEQAQDVMGQENAPSKIWLARMATTGEMLPIRVKHMLVSVSSKIYPAVSALLPVDEAAHAVYTSFGL
jgi:hypothetical protein